MAFRVDEAEQHAQVRALYEAIGRFVVEFEQAGHAMQVCIMLALVHGCRERAGSMATPQLDPASQSRCPTNRTPRADTTSRRCGMR